MPEMEVDAADQPDIASARIHDEAPITLQIGERRFTTTKSTLVTGSNYFHAFFSGRWTHKKLDDGTFFIDGDGDSFEHLLRYLRLNENPFFWDRVHGFDRQKYNALQATAEFFGVRGLSDWIKTERYTSIVQVITTTSFSTLDSKTSETRNTSDDNVKLSYLQQWSTKRAHICPHFSYHDGPRVCDCKHSSNRREARYVEGETVLHIITTREEFVFNWDVLHE
jgi:hypothetical protein